MLSDENIVAGIIGLSLIFIIIFSIIFIENIKDFQDIEIKK